MLGSSTIFSGPPVWSAGGWQNDQREIVGNVAARRDRFGVHLDGTHSTEVHGTDLHSTDTEPVIPGARSDASLPWAPRLPESATSGPGARSSPHSGIDLAGAPLTANRGFALDNEAHLQQPQHHIRARQLRLLGSVRGLRGQRPYQNSPRSLP